MLLLVAFCQSVWLTACCYVLFVFNWSCMYCSTFCSNVSSCLYLRAICASDTGGVLNSPLYPTVFFWGFKTLFSSHIILAILTIVLRYIQTSKDWFTSQFKGFYSPIISPLSGRAFIVLLILSLNLPPPYLHTPGKSSLKNIWGFPPYEPSICMFSCYSCLLR